MHLGASGGRVARVAGPVSSGGSWTGALCARAVAAARGGLARPGSQEATHAGQCKPDAALPSPPRERLMLKVTMCVCSLPSWVGSRPFRTIRRFAPAARPAADGTRPVLAA